MSFLLFRPSTGVADVPATPLPIPIMHTRVAWRPSQFNRISNPGFETNTTGWSVSAGINAAGTSITRDTTAPYAGTACGRLVTAATSGSGVNWDCGTDTFYTDALYGIVYVATVWLKRISGGHRVRLILGSEGGSSADRASLDIEDLQAEWRPYSVRWRPTGAPSYVSPADVQLAVTNGDDVSITVDIDSASIYADSFSQIENGDFETATTTGWAIGTGYITAAATSVAIISGDSFGGNRSMELVCTSSSGSGTSYPFGSRLFTSGRTYRARVALRWISGATTARLRLGSVGTAADRGDANVTITSTWAWFTLDWTPSGDRYDAALGISNASAAAVTVRIDEVEVYESADEVVPEQLRVVAGSRVTGGREAPGTTDMTILDPSDTYSPRNTGSTLYGTVEPGARMLCRATYEGGLYPVAYGTVRNLTPDVFAHKLELQASDGLIELDRADVSLPFTVDDSYRGIRTDVLVAAGLGARQLGMGTGIEYATGFAGTDAPRTGLSILDDLNDATGSIHYCEASPHAQVGWIYRVVDRATLTSAGSWLVLDEDFQRLTDVELRDESHISRQRVTWSGFDRLPVPLTNVAEVTSAAPYWVYSREEYGSTERPEPEDIFRLKYRWVRTPGWKKGDKGPRRRRRRKLKRVGTRWVDAVLPLVVPAGTRHTFVIDFSIPMQDIVVSVTGASDVTTEPGVARAVVHIDAGTAAVTVTAITVTGTPYEPRDEAEAVSTDWSARVISEGSPIDSEHITSDGMAQGLAGYVTWRWGTARLRPAVVIQHLSYAQLDSRIGRPVYLAADRWYIDGWYVVRSVETDVSSKGLRYVTTLGLEEMPPLPREWVTLDGTAYHGVGGTAILAH